MTGVQTCALPISSPRPWRSSRSCVLIHPLHLELETARLYKSSNQETVRRLYKTFDLLWENSSKNTEEESMQEAFDRETENRSRGNMASPIFVEERTTPTNLVLILTNNSSPAPLTDCRVSIVDLKIWSEGLEQFSTVGGFDHKNNLLPMRIYGPAALYADDPVVCYFIDTSDKKELRISAFEPMRTVILPPRPGIWCASLSVRVGTKEFPHRICFEWKLGETLRFIQCPDLGVK